MEQSGARTVQPEGADRPSLRFQPIPLDLDMAGEPRPGPTQPGQKRQPGTAISCSSNYDLDYKLCREDVPYRSVYECQRIPPLINRVPVKIRRTQVGMGIKSSCSPHKGPRKSHLPQEQIKLQTEELHSIRGELSQIKAQVDRLLETLERMDQQRDQLLGQAPPTGGPACTPRSEASEENRALVSKRSSCRNTEAKQEPRGQRPHPEADSPEDSTDPEEAVKNHASDQEGSQ
ncbi:RNA-binding Raly-like protein isoform X1 [Herpailurus yagouaroundi]|uniref:RNA-binding Raly-like protein isoform X1 n=2 Tax=Herpailurus yagouaroundi TaxID=1608482 RepID=UPI001AD7B08C|nr:RNA-binding Raly-like protein isoform X1 [Puma yagouaroundi]XP_040299034.1 RNA-binding Raly-like protein isoform X1 [Puma yagouaroundi]